MKKISVLGSGSWGITLACLLHTNSHKLTIWSYSKEEADSVRENREHKDFLPGVYIPKDILITNDPEEAVKDAEVVVFAVPSAFCGETARRFKPFISPDAVIVNVSKGIDQDSLKRLSEIIQENLPNNKVSVLSGPSHAEEVARQLPTTCVAASECEETAKLVQDLFMNAYFRIYVNTDLVGVELGGALKNVIALAAGISDGLGFGDNTKAALMSRGMVEIARLGTAMGASSGTFSGLSGIGDLIVTCTSMHSRNRRMGMLLGQGIGMEQAMKEVKMVVEGVHTAKSAYNLALKYNVDMPITTEIYNILFNGMDPRNSVENMMSRDKTAEYGQTYLY